MFRTHSNTYDDAYSENKPLNIFAKSFILDVSLVTDFASGILITFSEFRNFGLSVHDELYKI